MPILFKKILMGGVKPILSVVVVGRNDNYGGDFVERLQRGIQWNASLLEKNHIQAEFVVVNWNPMRENPSLKDLIKWPKETDYITYRIIEVSPKLHKIFLDQKLRDTVPMFEFLAKNVGIRRAKGEYVLCINADILIHGSIFHFIASNKLEKMSYYRANRLDFESHSGSNENEMIRTGTFVSLKGRMYKFKPKMNKEIQYWYFKFHNRLRLAWEFWKLRNSGFCNRIRLNVVYDNGGNLAHSLNSGDFMLMHRSHWHRLKGYSEYVFSAVHTDAIMTILAYSQLKEVIFDRPILHQQHDRRYSWKDMASNEKFAKTYQLFNEIVESVKRNEPVEKYLNEDNWGLNGHNLPELSISNHSNG